MSPHGTAQCYWRGCREVACRDAHRAYERARTAKKRAARGEALAAIPKMRTIGMGGWDTFTRDELLRYRGMEAH
jgi:hypothetical protein